MADEDIADLFVIGGGINGVGIAEDAAGRGLKVVLCEADDLASATSSASSKMIHGGLRYLENYEFGLVRKALAEREVLMDRAPFLVHPLRIVMPHAPGLRPAWMLRAGLFLYDHLSRRNTLAASEKVDLAKGPEGTPLADPTRAAFAYSDCAVDDSRLVVLVARSAADRGAVIHTRTRVERARRQDGLWHVAAKTGGGQPMPFRARALVNAAGPWAESVLREATEVAPRRRLRLVKGSHIVVPRLYEGGHAYILQNDDRRVIFVIPYEDDFTLIGTTEIAYEGSPAQAAADPAEVDYLCRAVSRYFRSPLSAEQVVWSFAGVRPLDDVGDAQMTAVTRDYAFDIDGGPDEPPLLSVFGGKLTTFRRLAEDAVEHLKPWFPGLGGRWSADETLPGGDGGDDRAVAARLATKNPWLPLELATRYARAYGELANVLLGDARSVADLGHHFGGTLFEREVAYLEKYEWARSPDDVLWRRTKQGLRVDARGAGELAERMSKKMRVA